ncbi:MAG: hypothetical protein WBW94_08155 [Anaerolineales bacterium]
MMQTIAAIDVGSNAIRMMVGRFNETRKMETLENIRRPVSLGTDAFGSGRLRDVTIQKTVNAFHHFQRVASDLEVTKIRAIATSAMREANNADILIDRVLRATGIVIEKYIVEELVIVGHEPCLGLLISALAAGDPDLAINVRYGSVCCLSADDFRIERRATLEWLLTPKISTKL